MFEDQDVVFVLLELCKAPHEVWVFYVAPGFHGARELRRHHTWSDAFQHDRPIVQQALRGVDTV